MAKHILTVICGVILLCALSFGALMLSASLIGFGGALISAAICIAIAIIAQKLHKWLPTRAVIIAECITLLIGIAGFAFTQYLDSIRYWEGEWFGGLFEMLLALSAVAVSLLTLITSIICQVIARKREKNAPALDISAKT